MKPRLNRWKPTTCECDVIEYTDENGDTRFVTAEEARVLHREIYKNYPDSTTNPDDEKSVQKPTKVCAAHSSIGEHKDLYDTMNDEGKRCMGVLKILLGHEMIKNLGLEKVKGDGGEATELKDGVEYNFSFEGSGKNRKLKAEVKGAVLTKAKKDAIKALADTKFGAGKVEIL